MNPIEGMCVWWVGLGVVLVVVLLVVVLVVDLVVVVDGVVLVVEVVEVVVVLGLGLAVGGAEGRLTLEGGVLVATTGASVVVDLGGVVISC